MQCPSFSSVAVVESPDQKQLRGESLFWFKMPGYSPLWWGSQGRNLKVNHIKSSQEQRDVSACLLGCLLTRLLSSISPLLHCSGPPRLGSDVTHCGLGLPIIYLRQFYRHAPGQANLDSLSLTLSSHATPGCVNLK